RVLDVRPRQILEHGGVVVRLLRMGSRAPQPRKQRDRQRKGQPARGRSPPGSCPTGNCDSAPVACPPMPRAVAPTVPGRPDIVPPKPAPDIAPPCLGAPVPVPRPAARALPTVCCTVEAGPAAPRLWPEEIAAKSASLSSPVPSAWWSTRVGVGSTIRATLGGTGR